MDERGLEQGKVNFNSEKGIKALESLKEVMQAAVVTPDTYEAWKYIKDRIVSQGAIDEAQLGTFIFDCVAVFIGFKPNGLDNPRFRLEQDFSLIAFKLGAESFNLFDGNVRLQVCNYIAAKLIERLRA